MLSAKSFAVAIIVAIIPVCLSAQPTVDSPSSFLVHHKQASSEQGLDQKYGSSVALTNGVLVAADENEHVEVLRQAADGTWAFEATIPSPEAGIDFGAREALATNGDWIAVGAKLDDTFGSNSGAVHMYKFDGSDWDYRGALSHMAPFGNIVTDQFGMALAMDGDRMVVGSRAENGAGAAGAVHYFQYNGMLDMWIESGFIASEHTSGNSTSKFAESVDISGDYMIVGEHRNNTNGNFAGAAHIYSFYNQCWHLQNVFYGHNADDILGKDVAISGTVAIAGSPFADTDGLNEAGAVTVYELVPFLGVDSAWAETAHFAPDGTAQGDWVGSALDIDGSLIAVGVPRDDAFPINGGAGYFLFDCSDGALTCVSEGYACDAMQNDRLGFDVAVSNGLAAIGATLDDNIYEDAGSVYILGAEDVGFECDLTAPGASEVDLVDVDDTGLSNQDELTRHTTPDFDVFLPGGGTFSVIEGLLAEAGDALIWYMEGTGDSTIHILTQEDIDAGVVPITFIYPGPVLTDGEYSFCSYVMDEFGNIGETNCLPIVIDNADPVASGAFNSPVLAFADTTLYLDADGEAELLVYPLTNLTATDNIGIDTLFVDLEEYDCSNLNAPVTVTLTAIDLAGNIGTLDFTATVLDTIAPSMVVQDFTVYLDESGTFIVAPESGDNGSTDACGEVALEWGQQEGDIEDDLLQTLEVVAVPEYNSNDVGWSMIAYEQEGGPSNQNGALRYLGENFGGVGDASFNLGPNLTNYDGEVLIVNGNDYYLFTTSEPFFGSETAQNMEILSIETNDGDLSAAIANDGGAKFCRAATPAYRPGDTSWGIIPNGSSQRGCGCNSGSWTGYGVYYGGTQNGQHTQCAGWGGRFAGWKSNGQQKGGVSTGYDTKIYVRNSAVVFDCSDVGIQTLTLVGTDQSGNSAQQDVNVNVVDDLAPSISLSTGELYLDENGSVSDQDLANLYEAFDNCGIDTSFLSQELSCADIVPFEDQAYLTASDAGDILFLDQQGNLASFNPETMEVRYAEETGLDSYNQLMFFNENNGQIYFSDGYEFQTLDVISGEIVSEFEADDQTGVMFDLSNGLGFEDLDAVETVDGVHYALSHDGDGYNLGNGNPLFSFEVVDSLNVAPDFQSLDSECLGCNPEVSVSFVKENYAENVADTITPFVAIARGNSQGLYNAITQDGFDYSTNGPAGTLWKIGATNEPGVYEPWREAIDYNANGQVGLTLSLWVLQGNYFFDVNVTSWTGGGSGGGFAYDRTLVDAPTWEYYVSNSIEASLIRMLPKDAPNGSDWDWEALAIDADQGIAYGICDEEQQGSGTSDQELWLIQFEGGILEATPCVGCDPDSVVSFAQGDNETASAVLPCPECDPDSVVAFEKEDFQDLGLLSAQPCADCAPDSLVTFVRANYGTEVDQINPYVALTRDPNSGGLYNAMTMSEWDWETIDGIYWKEGPTSVPGHYEDCITCDGSGVTSGNSLQNGGIVSLWIPKGNLFFDLEFTSWQGGGNGGGFGYTRTLMPSPSWDEPAWDDVVAPFMDQITPNVALAREHDGGGFFNGVTQTSWTGNPTQGVYWKLDSTSIAGEYSDCLTCDNGVGSYLQGGGVVSMWIPEGNLFFDLAFTSWTGGGNGGGFGYTRTLVDEPAWTEPAWDVGIGPALMDQITPNVALAREHDGGGFYNAMTQSGWAGYDGFTEGTYWKLGPTAEAGSYSNCLTCNSGNGEYLQDGGVVSLWIPEGNFFFDLDFSYWSAGNGGGFSYTRTIVEEPDWDFASVPTYEGMEHLGTLSDDVAGMIFYNGDLIIGYENGDLGLVTLNETDFDEEILVNEFMVDDVNAAMVGFTPQRPTDISITAIDVNGNQTVSDFSILVRDTISPVAIGQDITVELDANGQAEIELADIENGSYDNCEVDSLTLDVTSFDCDTKGENLVTLTAFDRSGNTGSVTVTVTVIDLVQPTAIAQDLTVYLDGLGVASIDSSDVDNGSDHPCGGIVSMDLSQSEFDCSHVGANTVTLTVYDGSGNSAMDDANVQVVDTISPSAIAQDLTVQLNASGAGSITAAQVDNGSSDACGIADLSLSQLTFDCTHLGANTVTLTVTDNNGNQSVAQATITVMDEVDPVVLAQNVTVQLDANGAGSVTASQVDNGSSDACGIASILLEGNGGAFVESLSFSCDHVGSNEVTILVTDVNGNESETMVTVTVEDNVNPTAMAQDLTVQLDASGAGSITAAQIDNGSSDACGIATTTLSQESFDCAHVGTNSVTLTVTDNNGNVSTDIATVTVEDNVDPAAIAQNITLQLDASGAASITASQIDNGSSDACGIDTITVSQESFDCSHVGANEITLTVTDNNGNVSTDIATVTVEDNVDPVAIAQNITLQLDASGAASIEAPQINNGSHDACGIATITVSQESFDCSHVGANEITFTVTDNNGNVSTDIATVTVEDKVDPVAIAQDLTVELDASGAGSITAAQFDNGSSDACGIATMTLSQESFDCTHLGANTVTLTVTDNNGNESTASATITVEDNMAPTVSASGVTVYLDENGSGTLSVASTASGVTDNCSVASLTISVDGGAPAESVDFDCSRVGDGGTEAEILVTDGSGNSTAATAIIIALDTISPVVLTQNLTIQLDVNGAASITAEAVNNGSSDACGIESLALNQADFDCSHVGTNTVTLTVTDVNGNMASATAMVTVQDNVNPQAVAQDLTVQLDADGAGSITVDQMNNGSSDACGIATTTLSQDSFDCSHVGANSVTLTVTDNNGNVSTDIATVTVEDNVNPQAVAQDLTVQLDANGAGSITAEQMNDGSSDACGVANLALSQTDFDCSHVGANTVTLTVTDNNGNQNTTTATITVEDNVDPSISLGASDMTVECDGNGNSAQLQAWLTDNGGAEASDACGISWSHDFVALSDDCGNTGSALVIFTVQDPNGNSVTTSATFTIEDKTNPSIDLDASNETVECDGAGNGAQLNAWLNSQGGAVASDICGGVVWTNNHSALSDDCGATGSTTVIFTATDDCGLTSTTTATFTIEDTTQPDIDSDPQDVVYQRDGNEAQAFSNWLTNFGGMTSTDVCGGTTQSHNSLGLTDECGSTGTETVTFTSTDDCNNTDARDATFTVIDEVAPSCPLIDLIDASDSGADMTDNITNDDTPTMRVMFTGVFTQSAESGDVVEFYINSVLTESYTIDQTDVDNGYAEFETGSHPDGSVSFSARHIDGCDQASIFAFLNINIHTTDPVAVTEGLTLYLDGNGNASLEPEDLDGGSSDDYNVLDLSVDQTAFDCSDLGNNTVTLTATDIAGNIHSSSATVVVVDDIAPSISSTNITVELDEFGSATISPEDVASATDNCSVSSLTLDIDAFDCSNVGDVTVTITAMDQSGNSSTTTANVTVQDNLGPVVEAMTSDDEAEDESAEPELVVVVFTFTADDYAYEGAASVSDGNGDVVGLFSGFPNSTPVPYALDLEPGTYTITLTDSYGDGWSWGMTGEDALVISGGASGSLDFIGGTEASLEFTVEAPVEVEAVDEIAVTFTFTADDYAYEGAASVSDGNGDVVGFFSGFPNSTPAAYALDLEPGTYTITLTDSYGDGWSWGMTGEDAVVISGGASGSLDFIGGSEVSLEFTVESPSSEVLPEGITVELGTDGTVSIEPSDVVASATDNCGLAGMSLDISSFDCDDLGTNALVLTVTDVNGNSTSVPAYVTVEDNQAPVVNIFDLEDYTLYSGETCVDAVDLFAAGQPWYEATDNCDFEVSILYDEINDSGVAGCREFDRRWIIEAVDGAGNMSRDTTLQHIVVLDEIAPLVFFDNAPEDVTIELGADCSADIPGAGTPMEFVEVTFTYSIDQYAGEADMTILNNDGDVVEFIDLGGGLSNYDLEILFTNGFSNSDGFTVIQTLSLAPGEYSLLLEDEYGDGWVWSSVDGSDALVISGNASGAWDFSDGSEVSGTFTVNEALSLDITASATDNCTSTPVMGDLTYTDSAAEYLCGDAGSFTITRTFSVTASDDCGNETVGQHIQTLTFLDVTAPQITDSESVDNGETVSESGGSEIFDFISIPNPINLDAEDACGGAVTIEETESFTGFIPTDDIGNYCGTATPAAFLDGDACNGGAPAALVLEGAYFDGEAFTIAEGGVNLVESYYDETLYIEVEVTNAEGTGGFIWSADYNEAFNWAQWNGLGRGYKKDCANVLPGSSPWTGWEFFVMQTGGMIGTGIYAGSELSLTHQPMNYYYGLQVGQGANNQNAEYGASAWFYWSGQLVVDGTSQGFMGSSGDIMLDIDCALPWSVQYDYELTDACGNSTAFGYSIEGETGSDVDATVQGGEGHQPFDVSVSGDLKEPIRVTGLMPNPTSDMSQLGFVVSSNMRLRVDLYTMSGELVQELYDGNAMSDVEYLMTIDAEGLNAGMYQIRIASNTYMAVKKLLVTQ